MTFRRFAAVATLAIVATPGFLSAQSQSPSQPDTRPATTTASGDTGLWYVPTGEVLPARKWSFSLYRTNFDYEQGFTDVSTFPVTFAVGVGDRVELFTSIDAVRRIDRDVRPLFFPTFNGVDGGGIVNEYPFVTRAWTGNQFGDVWVGAKFNVTSQARLAPVAFALRGLVKIPTADENEGAGTGQADVAFDAIVSREINERVELSGFGGFIVRGDPEAYDLLNGIRWGVGIGMPTRRNLRLTAELHGEAFTDNTIEQNTPHILAAQSSLIAGTLQEQSRVNATAGLTWQGDNGLFAGAGVNWSTRLDGRSEFGSFEDETGDSLGFQVRLGYHPGVRVYVAPAPPPPPPPAPAANRPPSVRASCNPCTVETGKVATVSADATDPDGDALTYQWSAASGALSNTTARQTPWTAPMQPGSVPLTVVVTDSKGATATDAVTIQVIQPAVVEVDFEDIHFDFDRYSLRPEAVRALDEVVTAMQKSAELRIQIEGHTCNIGTAEYNLALGERRAMAVREYLASRGIVADRLSTVSYGEERPKHDNAREETRRLNRRAALVVRVTR